MRIISLVRRWWYNALRPPPYSLSPSFRCQLSHSLLIHQVSFQLNYVRVMLYIIHIYGFMLWVQEMIATRQYTLGKAQGSGNDLGLESGGQDGLNFKYTLEPTFKQQIFVSFIHFCRKKFEKLREKMSKDNRFKSVKTSRLSMYNCTCTRYVSLWLQIRHVQKQGCAYFH